MELDVNWLVLMLYVGSGAIVSLLFTRFARYGLVWTILILIATPYILLIVVNLLWSNSQGLLGCALYLLSFFFVLRAHTRA